MPSPRHLTNRNLHKSIYYPESTLLQPENLKYEVKQRQGSLLIEMALNLQGNCQGMQSARMLEIKVMFQSKTKAVMSKKAKSL